MALGVNFAGKRVKTKFWFIVKDTIMATLPVGISKFAYSEMSVDYRLLMAGAAFGALPMILLFVFFQKYFVKGITMGAVKG